MTDVVTSKLITVPANTAIASFVSSGLGIGDSQVQKIEIQFPPGCAGLVGARVTYTKTPVYPRGTNSWFTFDDVLYPIEVTNQGNSGAWALDAYNLDYYAHNLIVYMSWNYLNQSQQALVAPLLSM